MHRNSDSPNFFMSLFLKKVFLKISDSRSVETTLMPYWWTVHSPLFFHEILDVGRWVWRAAILISWCQRNWGKYKMPEGRGGGTWNTRTHGYFVLSPVSFASRDQYGGRRTQRFTPTISRKIRGLWTVYHIDGFRDSWYWFSWHCFQIIRRVKRTIAHHAQSPLATISLKHGGESESRDASGSQWKVSVDDGAMLSHIIRSNEGGIETWPVHPQENSTYSETKMFFNCVKR